MKERLFKSWPAIFIVFQLLVIGWFIAHFNIEVQFNLPLLFPFMIGAFLIHAAASIRYRQWIFIGFTMIGLIILLNLKGAAVLVFLALLMIGICNLKVSLLYRKVLLLFIGMILTLIHIGILPEWISSPTLILLSSMFMFRMLLFVYEVSYQKKPVPIVTQLSYFLMLPNLIFPLFPVVDYKLFQRNYFDIEKRIIYQRGTKLIAKGVLYMFLYRIMYTYLLPTESEVSTLNDLITFIVFSYLLTIRLAGVFHFSVGLLCLFGYNLPDVFNRHFLASGFSDLWRRLNVYWKDFIVKICFNPVYFRLKKYGAKRAVFLATIIAFIVTLLLHSYQTFWLVGVFKVSLRDVVFWFSFAVMVALGGVLNTARLRKEGELKKSFREAGRVFLTFMSIALIWSYWVSDSSSSWVNMIRAVFQNVHMTNILAVLLIFSGSVLALGVGLFFAQNERFLLIRKGIYVSHAPVVLLLALVLCFNSWTLKIFWKDKIHGNDIHALFHFMLKKKDSENNIAGYYDNILGTSDLMSPLNGNSVANSKLFQTTLYHRNILLKSNDALKRRFAPNKETTIQDMHISTNSWGMYDQYYDKEHSASSYRIALMGGSIEVGWAIPYEQRLDRMLEEHLNDDKRIAMKNRKIEVLNFSVPSRSILNHCYALSEQVLDFKPDMVVFFDHDETEWVNIVNSLYEYDYSIDLNGYVDTLYSSKEILDGQPVSVDSLLKNMERHRKPLMESIYADISALCKNYAIVPLLVIMPEIRKDVYLRKYQHPEMAQELGFNVIDISDIFGAEDISTYSMDAVGHPTLAANRRIEAALYPEIYDLIMRELNKEQGVL